MDAGVCKTGVGATTKSANRFISNNEYNMIYWGNN